MNKYFEKCEGKSQQARLIRDFPPSGPFQNPLSVHTQTLLASSSPDYPNRGCAEMFPVLEGPAGPHVTTKQPCKHILNTIRVPKVVGENHSLDLRSVKKLNIIQQL